MGAGTRGGALLLLLTAVAARAGDEWHDHALVSVQPLLGSWTQASGPGAGLEAEGRVALGLLAARVQYRTSYTSLAHGSWLDAHELWPGAPTDAIDPVRGSSWDLGVMLRLPTGKISRTVTDFGHVIGQREVEHVVVVPGHDGAPTTRYTTGSHREDVYGDTSVENDTQVLVRAGWLSWDAPVNLDGFLTGSAQLSAGGRTWTEGQPLPAFVNVAASSWYGGLAWAFFNDQATWAGFADVLFLPSASVGPMVGLQLPAQPVDAFPYFHGLGWRAGFELFGQGFPSLRLEVGQRPGYAGAYALLGLGGSWLWQ